MCGIFGILSDNPGHFDHADRQLRVIEHRGPDEEGKWRGEGVFLGTRRLSIIDLAGGSQPIFNEDRTLCIVYNGELYNYRDLRPVLEQHGHVFRTHTDTEVVLHSFEQWGADCLRRFNGMFAFAIWSTTKKELFIARDRVGEKPLYYYQDAGRIVFGSEIKSIIADPTIRREINPQGLANFLAFGHSLAPDTMYRNIRKLLPGHYLIARGGRLEIVQYWDVGDEPQVPEGKALREEEFQERILTLLDDSVRRRMIADVPVGAFLSGGVDSSAVVALMKRHASGPVKTFSLGFDVGGAYDELSDAKRVADFLGTEHHELRVSHTDMVGTLLNLVYFYDEPYGDAANFPLYLLSEFARKHVKVVLAGEGGDELFGGYRRYVADAVSSRYQQLPGIVKRILPRVTDGLPRMRRTKRIFRTLPIKNPAYRYASWLEIFDRTMRERLLADDLKTEIGSYDPAWQYPYYYERTLANGSVPDHLNRIMYVDFKTWLPDTYMEKVDKATMAWGLEGRLPILDHRIVELAYQIPSKWKIHGLDTKLIFKRSVGDLLPPEVLKKPKHGFAVPTDIWFRGKLREFVFDTLLDPVAQRRGYFNYSYIEKLYRQHRDGKEVHDTALWFLLNFELWNRRFLDRQD